MRRGNKPTKTKTIEGTAPKAPCQKCAPEKPGRHSKYFVQVASKLEIIRGMRRGGWTEAQIANHLGVCPRSLTTYKQDHPELVDALAYGEVEFAADTVGWMRRSAEGYSTEIENTTIEKPDGSVITTKRYQHVPANVTAQIYITKNRDPEHWRDRTSHELTGPGGKDLQSCVHIFLPDNGRPVTLGGSPVDKKVEPQVPTEQIGNEAATKEGKE